MGQGKQNVPYDSSSDSDFVRSTNKPPKKTVKTSKERNPKTRTKNIQPTETKTAKASKEGKSQLKRESCARDDMLNVSPSLQVLAKAAAVVVRGSKKRKGTTTPTPTPQPIRRRKSGENRTFFTRTSPKGLYKLVRELTEAQKEAVKAIGFGSLLSLGISKCPTDLSQYLVANFNCSNSSLILSNGKMVLIDEEDVQCVLNLPRGEAEIKESNGKPCDGPEYLEMLRAWRTRWVGNPTRGAPLVASMPSRIKANTAADDDFKRDFIVYVVSSFLWTTQNSQARYNLLSCEPLVDEL